MPKISTYNTTTPKLDDKLIGTDVDNNKATKNFTIADIIALAQNVSYDDLEPLFSTAKKKIGTRIATVLATSVWLAKGEERTDAINDFLTQ